MGSARLDILGDSCMCDVVAKREAKANKILIWLESPIAIFIIGVLFSGYAFIQGGLTLYPWMQHGFQRTIKFSRWLPQYQYDVLLPVIKSTTIKTLALWHAATASVFEIPFAYVSFSAVTYAGIFYSFFLVGTTMFSNRLNALLATMVVVVGNSYIVSNSNLGIWQGLYFTDSSLTTLFVGIGLWLLLTDRAIMSSLAFAIAIQFHLFNGLCAFLFILAPSILLGIHQRCFRKSVCLCIFPAVIALLALYSGFSVRFSGHSELTLSEWIKFCYFRDPDDMTLTYWMGKIALPIAAETVTYISFRNDDKRFNFYDAFFICFAVICVAAVGVEILHNHGIVFGKITELFTVLQIRRGVWVFHLLAVYAILESVYSRMSSQLNFIVFLFLVFFILHLSLAQIVFPMTVLVLALMHLYFSKGKIVTVQAACYAFAFVGYIPLLGLIDQQNWPFDLFKDSLLRFNIKYFAAACVVALMVLIATRLWSKQIKLRIDKVIAYATAFAILLSVFTAIPGFQSRVIVAKSMVTMKNIHYKDILRLYSEERGVDETKFAEVLVAATDYGKTGRVLLPPTETLIDPTMLAGLPLFYFEYYDRIFALFSFTMAREYDSRLHDLFGKGLVQLYKGDFLANFKLAYDLLPPNRLLEIMRKHFISAVVTTKPLAGVSASFTNGEYWLYSISDISAAVNQ